MIKNIQIQDVPAAAVARLAQEIQDNVLDGWKISGYVKSTINMGFATLLVDMEKEEEEVNEQEEETVDDTVDNEPVVGDEEDSSPSLMERVEALQTTEEAKAMAKELGIKIAPAMKSIGKIRFKILEHIRAEESA